VVALIWLWSLWFFVKKFYKFHDVEVLSQDSHHQRYFYFILTSISKAKNQTTSGQLDLEAISKSVEETKRTLNLHELLSEDEVCYEKEPQKETLHVWTPQSCRSLWI
jgi:hypothetical protein